MWRWTSAGAYSARCCYLATFQGSVGSDSWKLTWRTWAPPKVKFFYWLADLGHCWTADHLARRGLPHEPSCVLCDQRPETMQHLLVDCPFSQQVWHCILSWIRATCQPPTQGVTLSTWWRLARRASPKPLRKGLDSSVMLTAWMIWKQRNKCTFENDRPCCSTILHRIQEEAKLWARAGALGLHVLLPESWDVHKLCLACVCTRPL